MQSTDWDRLQELFHSASGLPPSLRTSFLDRECAGDSGLRHDIEALLTASERDEESITRAIGEGAARFSSAIADSASGSRIGAYRIVRKLGEGGMGAVFLAERADERYERHVAIKLLRPEIPVPGAMERFHSEVRILANLNHPNIAYLLDSGITESGSPYLVMEYIDGVSIHDFCRASDLTIRERIRIFQAVCAAVEHAHRNLIIHRDIKPSNILVMPDGTPKLLDFGIAKLAAGPPSNLTRADDRVLTPEYASPEQIQGKPITTAVDVYGLGVLLYELLCDQRPFEMPGGNMLEWQQRVCESDPVPPSQAVEDRAAARSLRGDLDNIVLKALRREPADRYASVEQFTQDLYYWRDGRPVIATRGNTRYRAIKFVRRHRAGVAVAAAFALIVAAFLAGMTVFAARLAKERDRAQQERTRAEQVSRFLRQLFVASDPFQAKGSTVTARELLDRGAERISRELGAQPAVRSSILQTMAEAYQHLGIYDRAEALLQEGVAAESEAYGAGGSETATVLRRLGDIQRQRSELASAETNLRRALKIQQAALRPTDPELAHTQNNLGLVVQARGSLHEARALFEKAIEIERGHAWQFREMLVMMSNLGNVLQELGEFDRAEVQLREVMHERRRLLGELHPQVLRSMGRLGSLLRARGSYAEAERLLRAALDGQERVLGRRHADTLGNVNSLAEVLQDLGRTEDAKKLYREAVSAGKAALGDHTEVALWQTNLATLLMEQGQYAESERLYREALEVYRSKLGQGSLREARLLARLADLHVRNGSLQEAELLIEEAIQIDRKRVGLTHPETARAMVVKAELRGRQEQMNEARGLYEQAIAIDRQAFPKGHLQLSDHLMAFSGHLAGVGQAESAAAHRREAVTMRAAVRGVR